MNDQIKASVYVSQSTVVLETVSGIYPIKEIHPASTTIAVIVTKTVKNSSKPEWFSHIYKMDELYFGKFDIYKPVDTTL